MVDELYCQPKEEIIMGCFVEKNMEFNNSDLTKAKKKRAAIKTEKPSDAKIFDISFNMGVKVMTTRVMMLMSHSQSYSLTKFIYLLLYIFCFCFVTILKEEHF